MPNELRTDPQAVTEALELHAVADPRIRDLTYGKGAIYGRTPLRQRVIKCDIDQRPGVVLDHVVAWQDAPTRFSPHGDDVVVFDIIQVDDAGANSQFYGTYRTPENLVGGKGQTVLDQFPSMFDTAEYLLVPRTGIMLAKMADQVHANHYIGQCRALANYAESRGWTVCQKITVKNQRGRKKPSATTIVQRHLLNQVAEWYVFRFGPDCHGPGRRLRYELRCVVCRDRFTSRRSDALVCSNRCQKKKATLPIRQRALPASALP